jgi:hypothetical protein
MFSLSGAGEVLLTKQKIMNREIKFRAWDKLSNGGIMLSWEQISKWNIPFGTLASDPQYKLMQFTGRSCNNDREVFEGDILFYELPQDDGDQTYYLVVTWIEEWSMFATLFIDEYLNYLQSGADVLDEGLFWTYTIEGAIDYHYAGNIFENPDLLTK